MLVNKSNDEIHLKIKFIARFHKKVPHILWDKEFNYDQPHFDSMLAGQFSILNQPGFKSSLLGDKSDIVERYVGVNHFFVKLYHGSQINMQESMINKNIRKTETDIIIKNISSDIIFKLIAEIDRKKYLSNNGELEDLYLEIDPDTHHLKKQLEAAYRDVGFKLIKNNPAIFTFNSLIHEADLLLRLGFFNYSRRVIFNLPLNMIGVLQANAIDQDSHSSDLKRLEIVVYERQ